jgi:hypothetical protein
MWYIYIYYIHIQRCFQLLEWFLRETHNSWRRAFCARLPRRVEVEDTKVQLLWEASCKNWVWVRPWTPPFPSKFSE